MCRMIKNCLLLYLIIFNLIKSNQIELVKGAPFRRIKRSSKAIVLLREIFGQKQISISPEIEIIMNMLKTDDPMLQLNGLRGILRMQLEGKVDVEKIKSLVLEAVLSILNRFPFVIRQISLGIVEIQSDNRYWFIDSTIAELLAELGLKRIEVKNILSLFADYYGSFRPRGTAGSHSIDYTYKMTRWAMVQLGYTNQDIPFLKPPLGTKSDYSHPEVKTGYNALSLCGIKMPLPQHDDIFFAILVLNDLAKMLNSSMEIGLAANTSIYKNGQPIPFNKKQVQQFLACFAIGEMFHHILNSAIYAQQTYADMFRKYIPELSFDKLLLEILHSDMEELRIAASWAIGVIGMYDTLTLADKEIVRNSLIHLQTSIWQIKQGSEIVSYGINDLFFYFWTLNLVNEILFNPLIQQ